MKKTTTSNKKQLTKLLAEIKNLQAKLVEANKLEGKDAYIEVKIKKSQARGERVKLKDEMDKLIGSFYLEINVTAKQEDVFIPISIASGKKTAGLMYQIEGTAPGSVATAEVRVGGQGVTQVIVGTLIYAKIPSGKTASFEIRATTRGVFGNTYKIVITRLNYKLKLSDVRYLQYLKELPSKSI